MHAQARMRPRVAPKLAEQEIPPQALEVLAKFDNVELPVEEEEGTRTGSYVAYRNGHFQIRIQGGSLMQVGLDQLLAYVARDGSLSRLLINLARALNRRLPEDQRVMSF